MDYGPLRAWQVELGKPCSLLRQLILLLIFLVNKTYHFPLHNKSARKISLTDYYLTFYLLISQKEVNDIFPF